jgi:hypothetical protein
MTISKQQDDHQHHHGHDQHRNNHINNNDNNNVEYSLEKNKDCTSTTTNTRPESIFHQKKMIQQSSSSSRSLPPNFEIPKTLMSNDSIDIGNDNTNYNDSEKSIKFLRGLYSTLPEIKEKRQRRDTKRTTTTTTCTTTATLIMNHDHDHEKLNDATDTNTISISVITGILKEIDRDNSNKIGSDENEYEEIMIVPIQYDNYVNKRHMLSKDITSIAGKRRNELLLDDASGIYEAVRAMKLESKLLSSGEEEDDDDDVTRT